MKLRLFGILIAASAALALISPASALTKMGELSQYYIDYADVKLGATISSPCKANPDAPKLENIITPAREASSSSPTASSSARSSPSTSARSASSACSSSR